MKFVLELDIRCVDRILEMAPQTSAAHLILTRCRFEGDAIHAVTIVCEQHEAELIHMTAEWACPDIASRVRDTIDGAKMLQ